jgi:Transcription factor/nuclear export subunit protein 2
MSFMHHSFMHRLNCLFTSLLFVPLFAEEGKARPAQEPSSSSRGMTWPTLVEAIKGTLSEDVWKAMSPSFYIMFWGLTVSDIYVPEER